MTQSYINSIINKTVFITGNGKNAGKTTFMNYLLSIIRSSVNRLAYLTIGIDGEKEDMIFGTQKPSITVVPRDYIVTCDSALADTDSNFEIHEVFPYKTKLGKLILLKALRPGRIELIGPENNTQLSSIISFLKKEKNIKTIFVDGAVNRITQVASIPDASFIYVLKVSDSNLNKTIEEIQTLSLIKQFPNVSECVDTENVYEITGALTEIKSSKIPKNTKAVILNDFTKIFLSWQSLTIFLKKYKIFYRNQYKLSFCAVNLYNVSAEEFKVLLKSNSTEYNIIFNPYQIAFNPELYNAQYGEINCEHI